MDDDELLVEVRMPSGPTGAGWAFYEIARRHGDFALVGVAAMVALDDDRRIREARLRLMGVADRAVRAPAAEAALGRPGSRRPTRSPPPREDATATWSRHPTCTARPSSAATSPASPCAARLTTAAEPRRRSIVSEEIEIVVNGEQPARDRRGAHDARRLPPRASSGSPAPTSGASTASAARAP